MPELVTVIVNFNTRDLLKACLTDVKRHLAAVDAEIVVVDNASSDGSAQIVRECFPDVSLIANRENVGFARANNQAIRATDSRCILLLNTDAFLSAGTLERLQHVLAADQRAAVAGPRMYDGDGALLATAHAFESSIRLAAAALGFHRLLPTSLVLPASRLLGNTGRLHRLNYDAAGPVEVDWVSGACMLVRRSATAEVGLMDERFFMYMEDEDWCRRFVNAGHRVIYVPSASVTHHVGKSASSTSASARAYRNSRLVYHQKYDPHLYPLLWLMSNFAAFRQRGSLGMPGLFTLWSRLRPASAELREAEP